MKKTIAVTLADYASQLRYDDLPEEVVEKAKICVLEHLGLACRGYDFPTAEVAIRATKVQGAPGAATIWMDGFKGRAIDCVMANSVMAHVMLQDDFHPTSHSHIGVSVVPAAVTVGEERRLSGREILLATVVGYELEGRIGVLSVPMFKRGFRPTAVYSFFGSAATVAKLMGLPAERFKNALSFAGGVTGGTLQPWADGTMEWAFQEAFGCHAGVMAGLLAEAGFDGSDNVLEGEKGLNHCFSGTLEGQENALQGLGERFEITDVCFKRFPAGAAHHGSISAALDLQQRHQIDYREIRSVKVQIPANGTHERMNPEYPGLRNQGPFRNLGQCLISKHFGIAAVLKNGVLDGDVLLREQSNPEIAELAHKIHVEETRGIDGWNLYMDVEMEDGTIYRGDGSSVDQSQFYLDREAAGKKFMGIVSPVLGTDRAEQVLDYALRLDELTTIEPIIRLMRPVEGAGKR